MTSLNELFRLVLTSPLADADIARTIGVCRNTVRKYRRMCAEQSLHWDDLKDLSATAFALRFGAAQRRLNKKRIPDFARIHEELAAPGVTLQLLWEEYRCSDPADALSYSQFTHQYRLYRNSLKLSMRQTHVPGHCASVDFSGKRPGYHDAATGQFVLVELFVGVLNYSNYTFACATRSQATDDWIDANRKMLAYFGGVPRVIVPDNLKAAVIRPGALPELNRAFHEFAQHYGTVIMPARSRHPKDKSKVEVAVQIVQRWILAKLRHMQFFSLAELNAAIARLCDELNARLMKRAGFSRLDRLEACERHTLLALPEQEFELAQWHSARRIGPDYHLDIAGHAYSVPHHLVGKSVEARTTVRMVELFHDGVRVASHPKSALPGRSTVPEHMPVSHRAWAGRTPESLVAWAQGVGPATLAVVRAQFERSVPVLGLPAAESIRRLARTHGAEALEQACVRACAIQSPTAKSVRSLLSTGRLRLAKTTGASEQTLPPHGNLRGAAYYRDSAANDGASSADLPPKAHSPASIEPQSNEATSLGANPC